MYSRLLKYYDDGVCVATKYSSHVALIINRNSDQAH